MFLKSKTKHSGCDEPRLGLNQLNDGTDRRRIPLQDENHSGNEPHLVPGFPSLCSGMFPQRFRIVSVLVGSKEIHLVQTEHPKCGTLSCRIPGTIFCDPALNMHGNLRDVILIASRDGRVSWLAVLRMFHMGLSCNGRQLSLVSQCCHLLKVKFQTVVKT